MSENQSALVMKALKWLINAAILIYITILCTLFFGHGSGFELDLGLFRIKAHTPSKPLIIVTILIIVRILISLEIKNAVLLVISLIFSLGSAEMALRIIDLPMAREPELKQWRRPSPTLGWELIPNLKGRGHLGSNIEINSHGLRDVEHSWDKAHGTYRILGLGDSFAFGYGINREDTYLNKLEALFVEDDKPVEVINGGVIGYSLYQSITYLKQRGVKYHPDLVVFFYYIDDLEAVNSAEKAKKTSDELLQNREKVHGILSASYLNNFIKNTIVLLDVRFRSLTGAEWIKSIGDRKAYLADRMRDYNINDKKRSFLKELIVELNRTCNDAGAALLIAPIPDAAQIDNPDMQTPYRILEQECASLQIPFFDVTAVFEQQQDIQSLYLFPMDAHTSPKGNEIIAASLHEFIKNSFSIPSR